jgi:hypothetical protein
MGSQRFLGRLLAALAAIWLGLVFGLAWLGMPMRGCCGGPLRVRPSHEAALFAVLIALVCAGVGAVLPAGHRYERALGRTVPLLASALMLGLCAEALILPFCCCSSLPVREPTFWSPWHHYAVLALAMGLALLGARRPART